MTDRVSMLKRLREVAGVGVKEAHDALREFDWDYEEALDYLRYGQGRLAASTKPNYPEEDGFTWL